MSAAWPKSRVLAWMPRLSLLLLALPIAPCGGCAVGAEASIDPPSASAPNNAMPRELMLLQEGMNALKAGRFEEARKSLAALLAANPEPWVHIFIAEAWCREGNRDKAFEELDVAVSAFEKEPGSAGPMGCMLGLALVEDDAWQPIRADPRFAPMLARAKKAAWHPQTLTFDESAGSQAPCPRRQPFDAAELKELRKAYALESVVAGATSDLERVRRMCHWVHERTSHDGWNDDLPKDALGLLKVAEKGAQWRCVQFGIVVAECLNAVGIPARVVGGQARDVETLLAGAGHVFAEAWLEDAHRWVFVDAQIDLVAVDTDGTPLNSAQFRNALARTQSPFDYPRALVLCMHFFRYDDLEGGKSLMLGPNGSRMPTKFQRMPTRAPDIFTHRTADAYRAPTSAGTP